MGCHIAMPTKTRKSQAGSAHCLLAPYWAVRLNKNQLKAVQLSARTALITCILNAERITLEGNAITVIEGEINYA